MSDLLKEAIADAKAVRETALENAKMALEEAFTPRLQSMLSKKLQEEADADHEDETDNEKHNVGDSEELDEELDSSDIGHGDNKEPGSDTKTSSGIGHNSSNKANGDVYSDGETVNEADDEDSDHGEDEDDEDEDLDLDEIIAELEADLSEMDKDYDGDGHVESSEEEYLGARDKAIKKAMNTEAKYEDDEDEDSVEEGDKPYNAKDPEGAGTGAGDEDEELDLDEILRALSEIEEDSIVENEIDELRTENEALRNKLAEFEDAVVFMKDKLNEVNLLNAKLLYSNKLFRVYDLTNEQKKRVIETIDRTGTVREVKLVFTTLAESLKMSEHPKRKANTTSITEGLASKSVGSTRPSKKETEILSESAGLSDRWKKLAGIKNKN